MDGVFSFSILPLRLARYVGFVVVIFSTAMGLLHLVWRIGGFRLMGHTAAELPGWTTLASGMFFFAGLQLFILGLIGEYIGGIYTEIKQRPRWVIREKLGFEDDPLS
jgi:dolichol-phosphate mannosyltransferase